MYTLNDIVAVRVHSGFAPVGRITCLHKPRRGHLPRYTVELRKRGGGTFKTKQYVDELVGAVYGPLSF